MPQFKENDVVRFADGNGKMFLWGDTVTIDEMYVKGYAEDGRVEVTSSPYTFTLEESALVKVGEMDDMHYDDDGNEVYTWLTELNEPEEEPED